MLNIMYIVCLSEALSELTNDKNNVTFESWRSNSFRQDKNKSLDTFDYVQLLFLQLYNDLAKWLAHMSHTMFNCSFHFLSKCLWYLLGFKELMKECAPLFYYSIAKILLCSDLASL